MRKLGMIGGMSWASTGRYYEHINRLVQRRTSPACSAPLVIESLNFCDLSRLSTREQWDHAAATLGAAAQRLEQAGAGAIIVCANSMHKVHDRVAAAVGVPVLHIADVVAEHMLARGARKATLVGTRNVMTESFYRERLIRHGIALSPPNMERVEDIDRIIYDELMQGIVRRESERVLKTHLTNIAKDGVDGVVLACTELEMIVDVDANVLPIFDSTRIHAEAAVEWIMGGD